MLTKLKGNNTLVQNILKVKGVPYEYEDANDFSLQCRDLELQDEQAIISYIDERFPIPQIISGDVENRARIREIANTVRNDPTPCDYLANHANPFVFGDSITLVDLIVYEHTSNAKFKKFLSKILKTTDDEGW